MKKLKPFVKSNLAIGSLSLLLVATTLYLGISRKQGEKRTALQIMSEKYKNMSLEEVEAIPKRDRPDLAILQNFEMTKDPSLNIIPVNRARKAFAKIKSSARLKSAANVNWEERGPNNVGGRTRALMFDPNDASGKKVWAGGVAGGLWYNNDITSSSSVWQNVDDFWANLAISCIAHDPTNTNVFYVGTGEGFFNSDAVRGAGIWKTTDAGATWSQLSSTDNNNFSYVLKLALTPTGTIIAATKSGLYRSTDDGASWTNLFSGSFADIEVASNGDIYCSEGLRDPGVVRKSTNDGESWATVTPSSGGERIELAIAPSDPNTVYAVASKDSDVAWFKKTTNGGGTWSNVDIPNYYSQSCYPSSDDFTRKQAWYDLILSVHPTNPNTVLVGGIDLYKSTNGGSSWGLISYWTGACDAYVHADQHAIQFSPVNENTAIFGNDGGVFYSSDVGNASNPAFSARNNGYNVTQYYAGDQENKTGSNIMLAGAQDNGTQRYSSAGINATSEVTGGDGAFCHIDQLNSDYQITSYVFNNIYRSTNGGANFQRILRNSTGRFINPTEYDDNAKVLYGAAGNNEYLKITNFTGSYSTDFVSASLGGNTISAIKASPFTDNRIFVGTGTYYGEGGSKIFKISNAHTSNPTVNEIGTSALPRTGYISSIDVGANEDQLIITYSNYGLVSIWESTNGGASWQNKEGDLPDIPVRSVLYNPLNRNEVIIATELGVWSTANITDASPNWVVTNTGLANVRCDMLQYRASDGNVMVVTHGRGVYTGKPFAVGPDEEPPTVPTGLVASGVTSSGFVLNWNASSDNFGVTAYNVSVNGTIVGTPSTTNYSVSGLDASTTYNVTVVALDAAGNVSEPATISVTTNDQTGLCNGAITAFPYSESFESGFGAWEQDDTDDINWDRDTDGTPSNSTGPSSATDGDYYLYIESSYNGTGYPNKNAIIYTPCFDVTALSGAQLSFWYNMYGSSMGTLAVEASTDGGATYSEIWSLSGDQGTAWKEVKIDLASSASLKLRFSGTTATSYTSDMAIDNVQIMEKVVGPQCPSLEIGSLFAYAGQDRDGDYTLISPTELQLENNTWKYMDLNYTITTNTILEFEFKSTSQGEIHGIGLDNNNEINSEYIFQVYGTQDWGIKNYFNYSGSNWKKYSIPVGSYYSGDANRLAFVNDNDNGTGNTSYFRNIVIHEGNCGASVQEQYTVMSDNKIEAIMGTEPEGIVGIYPNPVKDQLTLQHNFESASYAIYSLSGKIIDKGLVDGETRHEINTSELNNGMYILKVDHANGNWSTKFSKD